ncbi:major facilitator superfamily domain-containing protein [Clohesyomyces aquaticus]|uniref:Major facilitator superfamily domain-containing protein n=1 Tax=Clohesyomyces aquaticus TaxID=1231657 RepID=A0A1Y1Y871_9PLEO|nr:major facilitator superfamily domain-containing protein [Clohesyomyces aquaticus]
MRARRSDEEGEGLLEVKELIENTQEEKITWKNLPHKKQLLLLALCRLSSPLSNACLLPYLYYLVRSILSDPNHPSAPQQISRMTGLLAAAFPLGQMMTSMLWGRLSDTYGRKPTILLGLTISVIANLSFGFSRTIGMLLFWRVLAGMANGTLGVMRTMTAEIVKEKKHHSRAFLAPPVIFNSGRVAALAIGGCLADPVDNLPALFGPGGLFNFSRNPRGVAWAVKYPYAMPAIFNGVVLGTCLILAALWLKESLETREKEWDLGIVIGKSISGFVRKKILRKSTQKYTPLQDEEADAFHNDVRIGEASSSGSTTPTSTQTQYKAHRPPFREIWSTHLLMTLVAFALQPLHNSTFLHIFPVFLSMPSSPNEHPTVFRFTGGLGLASPTVGLYLATFGICGILLQLYIYPRVHKRVGTLGALRVANFIFPLVYLFAPYLSLLSAHKKAKWPAMAGLLFSQIMGRTMAIPSTVILLTEAAPRKSVLGTVHGAGNTVSALASAGGPLIGGLLLARGIDAGAVGVVWWAWLCLIALVALGWSFVLRSDHGEEGKDVEMGVVGGE